MHYPRILCQYFTTGMSVCNDYNSFESTGGLTFSFLLHSNCLKAHKIKTRYISAISPGISLTIVLNIP